MIKTNELCPVPLIEPVDDRRPLLLLDLEQGRRLRPVKQYSVSLQKF